MTDVFNAGEPIFSQPDGARRRPRRPNFANRLHRQSVTPKGYEIPPANLTAAEQGGQVLAFRRRC